jgi:uncharacterized membrane protein YhaH (DUF805 family)
MNWYLNPWKKYAQFGGRARRMEYWTFTLVNLAIWGLLFVFGIMSSGGENGGLVPVLLVCWTFGLAAFIPMMACAVRRLHDTGKSGWWLLLIFVPVIVLLVFSEHPLANRQLQDFFQYPVVVAPIVGGAILTVFLLLGGNPGANRLGPNPRESA